MSDFNVGFVIFPGITQLDFTGPFEVLSRLRTPPSITAPSKFPQSKTHVIAKTMLPVSSDRGLGILPTCTFENCPPLDLICVPGGARCCGGPRRCRDHRLHSPPGRARRVCDLCLHGRLSAWCGRVAEGASGYHPLGLCRPVAPGRRHSRKGAQSCATAMSSPRAVSLRELTSHSTSLPSSPDRRSRKLSNSGSSTTRLLPSMSATLTRHPRRPLRSWFTATGLPTKVFRRSSRN